jgi:hypothetical protein
VVGLKEQVHFGRASILGDVKIKSTTPAANRLCGTLTIIALRPPHAEAWQALLEKEGKVIILNINPLTTSIS